MTMTETASATRQMLILALTLRVFRHKSVHAHLQCRPSTQGTVCAEVIPSCVPEYFE